MKDESKPQEFEVIHTYTRKDALADGVLVDVSSWAREAGFRFPVAVTRAVWEILEPNESLKADGQDVAGRAWNMLMILLLAIREPGVVDEVHFAPLFVRESGKVAEPVALWAKCGPGDEGEPVITVMMPNED
jgi:hypothetical protein